MKKEKICEENPFNLRKDVASKYRCLNTKDE